MTTAKETCPKCGSLKFQEHRNLHTNELTHITFSCESSTDDNGEPVMISRLCHARCRITELEKENERLREVMDSAIEVRNFVKFNEYPEFGSTGFTELTMKLDKMDTILRRHFSTLLDKGEKTE
jgi:hypothetical protein